MAESEEHQEEASPAPPLLEIDALRVFEGTLECPEVLRSGGNSLALLGKAQRLLGVFTETEIPSAGSVRLLGCSAQELFQKQIAGYAPQRLPLFDGVRLDQALTMSARLVGFDKADVQSALERCQLTGHAKSPLGRLSRLQHRLAGLAHGLCGSPSLLVAENLLSDLDDAEAELIESILDVELRTCRWIMALDGNSPSSRNILALADEVLGASESRLLGPLSPDQLRPEGFWVVGNKNIPALAARLRSLEAIVTQSPRSTVLLVHGVTGREIFLAAQLEEAELVELLPTVNALEPC